MGDDLTQTPIERHGSGTVGRLQLLPFLDILVAATGVFILIIALQDRLSETQHNEMTADVLMIVRDNGRVDFLRRGDQTLSYRFIYSLEDLLRAIAHDVERQVRIVAYFGADAIGRSREVQQELDRLATWSSVSDQAGGTGGDETEAISFRLDWRPLSGKPGEIDRLIRRWQEAPGAPPGNGAIGNGAEE